MGAHRSALLPSLHRAFPESQEHLWEINQAELRKHRTTRTVTVAVLVPLAAVLALVNVPSLTDCSAERPDDSNSNKHWFRAIRIVVQPWWGPHHVYGVFDIPVRYKRDRLYTTKLVIHGFSGEFSETSPEGGVISKSPSEPGYYIKRMSLPTRTALWFLVTGRFGDLRMPCHWWLVISDRVR